MPDMWHDCRKCCLCRSLRRRLVWLAGNAIRHHTATAVHVPVKLHRVSQSCMGRTCKSATHDAYLLHISAAQCGLNAADQ
jgi:hypothetical protein